PVVERAAPESTAAASRRGSERIELPDALAQLAQRAGREGAARRRRFRSRGLELAVAVAVGVPGVLRRLQRRDALRVARVLCPQRIDAMHDARFERPDLG